MYNSENTSHYRRKGYYTRGIIKKLTKEEIIDTIDTKAKKTTITRIITTITTTERIMITFTGKRQSQTLRPKNIKTQK